jgi:hypothetical protein
MTDSLARVLTFIESANGQHDKATLAKLVASKFNLTNDRSVYYCGDYALRFSGANSGPSFSNTVLSLSKLQKFDDRPFIVCLVTPRHNYCFIANTTFLKKISHSSRDLRVDNIRGSFIGSDISMKFDGIKNCASNADQLFASHVELGFAGNLIRLVEATNNISPSGNKFNVSKIDRAVILHSPERAKNFVQHSDLTVLKAELDQQVEKFKTEILTAALIDNVNIRGRIIEYLIAGEDELLRQNLINSLTGNVQSLPKFTTDNKLGDYQKRFDEFITETDVKTKILILNSNPKAYNFDKMLEFLGEENSVFLFYFVGIDPGKKITTALVSIFQQNLLESTFIRHHWAGRNSRGVAQFNGQTINDLLKNPDNAIDLNKSKKFLKNIIKL